MIEPLPAKCPKCGYINHASAMNCLNCHINMDWARANRQLFEVDSKPEQLIDLVKVPAAPAMQPSHSLEKKTVFTLMIVAFILILIFFAGPDLNCLFGLLLVGGLIWLGRMYEANQEATLEKNWLELARETGLAYIPGKGSFFSYTHPKLQGEYRGVFTSIEYRVEGGGGEYDVPVGFTMVRMVVRNDDHSSLEINSNWMLLGKFRKHKVLSGNDEFDRHFQVRGTPQELIYRVIRLTHLQNMLLLDRSQSKIMRNPYPFSWSSYCSPSIQLKGTEITCELQGVYQLVSAQVAMLNVLCDLVELVAQMGRE